MRVPDFFFHRLLDFSKNVKGSRLHTALFIIIIIIEFGFFLHENTCYFNGHRNFIYEILFFQFLIDAATSFVTQEMVIMLKFQYIEGRLPIFSIVENKRKFTYTSRVHPRKNDF